MTTALCSTQSNNTLLIFRRNMSLGGSYITTVSATDPDLGLNGTIKYSISAGDRSRFQVNARVGLFLQEWP